MSNLTKSCINLRSNGVGNISVQFPVTLYVVPLVCFILPIDPRMYVQNNHWLNYLNEVLNDVCKRFTHLASSYETWLG